MLTVCWAAKGGCGTTAVAAGIALAASTPALLVDLTGGLPIVLGVPEPATPGVSDWLCASAPPARLAGLEVPLGGSAALVPWGHAGRSPVVAASPPAVRWRALAEHLRGERRHVVVDAGQAPLPPALARAAGRSLLVTRNCFVALHAAVAQPTRPSGVVLVEEPGRRLDAADIEHSLGVPVVSVVLVDPAVARAIDSGLVLGRLPGTLRRALAPLGRPDAAGAEAA